MQLTAAETWDLKPEKPIRTAINQNSTVDALRYGYKRCIGCGFDPEKVRLQDIVWALLVEAARVERTFERPAGKGFGNGWPDVWRSAGEEFENRRSRLESGLPEYDHTPARIMPTAAQISRCEEVMVWLRFIHADDKVIAKDVLWGRARGESYEYWQKMTGLTVKTLKNMRSEQLRNISDRLRKELIDFPWESAVFYLTVGTN